MSLRRRRRRRRERGSPVSARGCDRRGAVAGRCRRAQISRTEVSGRRIGSGRGRSARNSAETPHARRPICPTLCGEVGTYFGGRAADGYSQAGQELPEINMVTLILGMLLGDGH